MGKIFDADMAQKYGDVKNSDKWNVSEFHDKIVGITFVPKEHLLEVKDGDVVVIRPELNNKFDEFACQVMHDKTGNRIGYIKKDYSKKVWENIQLKGDLYLGKVSLSGQDKEQMGINVEFRHFSLKE